MRRLARIPIALALALVSAAAASAQPARRAVLTLEGARAAAEAAAAAAREKQVGGAIAVVDEGGHLLYLVRLDGTFPAAAAVATAKARTAALFRRPTLDFETAVNGGRVAFLGNHEATPLQGGVPIRIEGDVVGAVGVSGAASAAQDEEFARLAAGAVAKPAAR
jgi:glc operon protein GlcG